METNTELYTKLQSFVGKEVKIMLATGNPMECTLEAVNEKHPVTGKPYIKIFNGTSQVFYLDEIVDVRI